MKKLNRRGFSLIELLIAVVILGIVVVPLLHVFLSSANTASKTRQRASADKVAQNAAEVVQANSLSVLLGAGVSPAQETFVKDLFGAEDVLVSTPDETTGEYTVTLGNVRYGDSYYDVRLSVDPSAYQGEGGINSTELTQYTSMDAVYAAPIEASGVDLSTQIRSDAQNVRLANRSINVTITGGTEQSPTVSVSAVTVFTYTYEVENASTHAMQTFSTQVSVSGSSLLPAGYTVKDGEELSVYLFMTPCYAAAGRTDNKPYARVGDQDDIQINNTGNLPCKVFIIKEDDGSGTAAQQVNYKATVDLSGSYTTWPAAFVTRVFSNLAKSTTGGDTALAGVRYQQRYSTTSLSYKRADFEDNFSLVDHQATDRFYDVTVEVFAQGTPDLAAATPLSSLKATKLQ